MNDSSFFDEFYNKRSLNEIDDPNIVHQKRTNFEPKHGIVMRKNLSMVEKHQEN